MFSGALLHTSHLQRCDALPAGKVMQHACLCGSQGAGGATLFIVEDEPSPMWGLIGDNACSLNVLVTFLGEKTPWRARWPTAHPSRLHPAKLLSPELAT